MLDYINQNFDVESMPNFNNVDGLKAISSYLDFAISSTIRKQIPNITPEGEKYYAKIILENYMNGDARAFTSQHNIRSNVIAIGQERIKSLLLKTMIETGEYNRRVLHQLVPQDQNSEIANVVTNIVYSGQIDEEENRSWMQSNIESFIEVYVDECYGKPDDIKDQREELCYGNDMTRRALEQLNLEMSLNRIKN